MIQHKSSRWWPPPQEITLSGQSELRTRVLKLEVKQASVPVNESWSTGASVVNPSIQKTYKTKPKLGACFSLCWVLSVAPDDVSYFNVTSLWSLHTFSVSRLHLMMKMLAYMSSTHIQLDRDRVVSVQTQSITARSSTRNGTRRNLHTHTRSSSVWNCHCCSLKYTNTFFHWNTHRVQTRHTKSTNTHIDV